MGWNLPSCMGFQTTGITGVNVSKSLTENYLPKPVFMPNQGVRFKDTWILKITKEEDL
jgi:hypothetical protein